MVLTYPRLLGRMDAATRFYCRARKRDGVADGGATQQRMTTGNPGYITSQFVTLVTRSGQVGDVTVEIQGAKGLVPYSH
jgi:hypothetical protein